MNGKEIAKGPLGYGFSADRLKQSSVIMIRSIAEATTTAEANSICARSIRSNGKSLTTHPVTEREHDAFQERLYLEQATLSTDRRGAIECV